MAGGAGSTGTVTLTSAAPAGGAVVTLASNMNAATVPASVTVAAEATTATFAITTHAVAAVTAVTITATYSGVAKTATLTVNPPALNGVTVNPTAVTGARQHRHGDTRQRGAGGRCGGDAGEQQHQCGDGAGHGDGTCQCHDGDLRDYDQPVAATAVTITATYNGVAKTATLTVNPAGPAALASVAMNPATMIFGSVSTGTVTLTAPAPAGGAVIALSGRQLVASSSSAPVTIPAGGDDRSVHGDQPQCQARTVITASYNGVNKTATLESVISNSDCVDLHTQSGDRR